MDEGYIKFRCDWKKSGPFHHGVIAKLNSWRDRLYDLGLIGAYENKIGFGNISIRHTKNTFIISGSATGNLKKLDANHYTLVEKYDLTDNSLECTGPIIASSESMSHAAVYESCPDANAVIHVHSLRLWKKLLNNVPTTNESVPYGTPEMAYEIKRILNEPKLRREKIIVMAGHIEGIIIFGKTLDEAGEVILGYLNR